MTPCTECRHAALTHGHFGECAAPGCACLEYTQEARPECPAECFNQDRTESRCPRCWAQHGVGCQHGVLCPECLEAPGRALAAFVEAAEAVSLEFDRAPGLEVGYPAFLPSFDEAVQAFRAWQDAVTRAPSLEGR